MEIEKIELDKILKNRDNYNTSNHGKVDDYNEYIKKFDSKNWIDRFNKYEKITIKKEDINLMWKILKLSNINGKFPKLYLEELDYLVDKYNNNLINNNFIRTDKTSLKNGCYGIKPYNNLREILESLLTTKFGHHGFNYNDDEININKNCCQDKINL
jgi:hypothetical protein